MLVDLAHDPDHGTPDPHHAGSGLKYSYERILVRSTISAGLPVSAGGPWKTNAFLRLRPWSHGREVSQDHPGTPADADPPHAAKYSGRIRVFLTDGHG
jgi:hypothetical protein